MSRVLPNRTRIPVLVALIALFLAPAAQASKPRKPSAAAPQTLQQVLDQVGRRAPVRSAAVSVAIADELGAVRCAPQ